MPPPESVALQAEAKWSRPRLGLISGVRPNSARVMTRVFSSRPRCSRSSSSAAMTWSSSGTSSWCVSKFWPWLSHQARPRGRTARPPRPAGGRPAPARRTGSARTGRGPSAARCEMSNSVSLAIRPRTRSYASLWLPSARDDRPALEPLAQEVAQLGALHVVELGDVVEAADVLGDHARGQFHRRVARAEEAGRAGRHAAPLGRRVERDVIGHLAIGLAQLAGQHGAQVGIAHARRRRGGRCIISRAPPPWSPFLVFSERMMQVCFIRWAIFGISSEMWMPGTDGRDRPERAAGRRARLGVPGLQLARAAGQPEQDDALLLPLAARAASAGALEDVQRRHVGRERRRRRRRPCRGSRGGRWHARASRRRIWRRVSAMGFAPAWCPVGG